MSTANVYVSIRSRGLWARVIIENRTDITIKGRVNTKEFVTVSCFSFMSEKQMYPSTVTAIRIGNSDEIYESGSRSRWHTTFVNDLDSIAEGYKDVEM